MINVENVTYTYMSGGPFEMTAVNDISLKINDGEFVGLIGHTGSGKSTLIQMIAGLLKPTSGRITVNNHILYEKTTDMRKARFETGLVMQYPEYQLFEDTVYKDIAFGPMNMGLPEKEVKERVYYAAELVGFNKDYFEKSPFDLSGGQKRRAAIAGVMSMEPEVLIFDEPAAGLDPRGRKELIEMIRAYRKMSGSTVIIVSHSMEDIASIADRIIVMNNSRVAMNGTVDEVYSRGDELRAMGLNVPEITEIFAKLRLKGIDVPANVYKVEDGAEILRSLAGRCRR